MQDSERLGAVNEIIGDNLDIALEALVSSYNKYESNSAHEVDVLREELSDSRSAELKTYNALTSMSEKLAAAKDELSRLKNIENDAAGMESEISRLRDDLSHHKAAAVVLSNKLSKSETELKSFRALNPVQLKKQNKRLSERNIELNKSITKVKARNTELSKELTAKRTTIQSLKVDLSHFEASRIWTMDAENICIFPMHLTVLKFDGSTYQDTHLLYMNNDTSALTLLWLDDSGEMQIQRGVKTNMTNEAIVFAKNWLTKIKTQGLIYEDDYSFYENGIKTREGR